MRKAKVKNGRVLEIWPRVKVLPDGTTVTKELPHHYLRERHQHVIEDVPDDVEVGWLWNEEEKRYAPRPPRVMFTKAHKKPKHSDLLEVVAEKLGVPYEDLWNEVMARKQARRAAAKD